MSPGCKSGKRGHMCNKRYSNEDLLKSGIPVPEWWESTEEQIQAVIDNEVHKGQTRLLAVSPGGREIKAVYYGEAEPELKGTANFNSAIAAGSPDYFFRRGLRKRPVLVLLAGVHGQELEGMVGAVSVLKLMETGKDLMGMEQPSLLSKLEKLRLVVIPIANPDGRARVPYDGWVGLPYMEMTKYGQGTRLNGKLYGWPYCKAVHPMVGDVGILGGYFDDAGINIQKDDYALPMSPVTRAVLELVRDEGPDMLINIHGHEYDPCILPVPYIPDAAKKELLMFYNRFYATLKKKGYTGREFDILGSGGLDGEAIPSFDLDSMLYHTGAGTCFTFESPHGCSDMRKQDHTVYEKNPYNYDDILKIYHLLIEDAADFLL